MFQVHSKVIQLYMYTYLFLKGTHLNQTWIQPKECCWSPSSVEREGICLKYATKFRVINTIKEE